MARTKLRKNQLAQIIASRAVQIHRIQRDKNTCVVLAWALAHPYRWSGVGFSRSHDPIQGHLIAQGRAALDIAEQILAHREVDQILKLVEGA